MSYYNFRLYSVVKNYGLADAKPAETALFVFLRFFAHYIPQLVAVGGEGLSACFYPPLVWPALAE